MQANICNWRFHPLSRYLKELTVRMNSVWKIVLVLTGFLFGTQLMASPPGSKDAAVEEVGADAVFMKGSEAILDQDYRTAFDLLSQGVAMGHAPSKAGLGFLCFNGWGCEMDLQKARRLYEESAAAGAHQGLNNLAHLYRYGLAGLDKDLTKAIELLEKAAKLGNEKAAYTLADLYRSNELGEPDLPKSIEWLQFGAERNYAACLTDLGFAYQHGIFVQKDMNKVAELFQKSLDAGSPRAASNLGYMYLKGEGVAQNYDKALGLFQQSAHENDVGGIINLAVMRFNGLGCERDPKSAFSLLARAVELGSDQARDLLKDWRIEESNDEK
jgi:uncharacterized protein